MSAAVAKGVSKKGGGGRSKGSRDSSRRRRDQYEAERVERYGKLRHHCAKTLRREAKVVKSFECQKVVRKIKSLREGDGKCAGNDDIAPAAMRKAEARLAAVKKFDLERAVEEGLRRLGVPNLDPSSAGGKSSEEEGGERIGEWVDETREDVVAASEAKEGEHDGDDPKGGDDDRRVHDGLVESMLRHRRLSAAIDELDRKVTEFRRWTMKREAALRGDADADGMPATLRDEEHAGVRTKKRKRRGGDSGGGVVNPGFGGGGAHQYRRTTAVNLAGHGGSAGLFLDSLSGDAGVGPPPGNGGNADEDDYYYGPGSADYTTKRKNRPGQRARKAKAMAIEAQREGRSWDSSVNWREKKKRPAAGDREGKKRDGSGGGHASAKAVSASGLEADAKVDASRIAEMGKSWKEEGQAHPSWAARHSQKNRGIAEFTGKKITFD